MFVTGSFLERTAQEARVTSLGICSKYLQLLVCSCGHLKKLFYFARPELKRVVIGEKFCFRGTISIKSQSDLVVNSNGLLPVDLSNCVSMYVATLRENSTS